MRVLSLLYVLPLVAATVANGPRDPRRHSVTPRAVLEERGLLDGLVSMADGALSRLTGGLPQFGNSEETSTAALTSAAPVVEPTKPAVTTPTAIVNPPPLVTLPTPGVPTTSSTASSTGGLIDTSNPPSPSAKPSSSSSPGTGTTPGSSSSSLPSAAPGTSSSLTSSNEPSSSAAPQSSSSSAPPSASTSAQPSPSATSSESSSEEKPTSTQSTTEYSTSAFVSTNAQGGLITIYRTIEQTAAPTASSAEKKDEGLSKGAIIGIAVGSAVGGIALIAGLIFALTRRRNEPGGEAILWPELNHHGDADTHHALPVSGTGSRMSLGEELEGPAVYYGEKGYEYPEHEHDVSPALNGTAFGGSASFADYDQQYPAGAAHSAHSAHGPADSYYEHASDDYSNMPPPVQPRTSPVQPAYEWDGSQEAYDGYAGVHRQESPPMTGVGAGNGAGVGAGSAAAQMPVSFNPASHHGQY